MLVNIKKFLGRNPDKIEQKIFDLYKDNDLYKFVIDKRGCLMAVLIE